MDFGLVIVLLVKPAHDVVRFMNEINVGSEREGDCIASAHLEVAHDDIFEEEYKRDEGSRGIDFALNVVVPSGGV